VKGYSLRYATLTSKLDQLWFPAALWVLFAFIAIFQRNPKQVAMIACSYLGFVVPLTAGMMGAYAILDDPALELRFAAPIPAWRTLLERLGFIFLIQAAYAVAYQILTAALGSSLSNMGTWPAVQLAWLIPTISLLAVGSVIALAGRKPVAGALMAGLVWLVEVIARGAMAGSDWAKYVLIFMGALMPDHPALVLNQVALASLSMAFLVASWALLRKQERYL
jgi:hypothetical protein